MTWALLGIDVGWSESRPTCGIAFRGPGAARVPGVWHGNIVATQLRISAMREFLATLLGGFGRDFERLAIVIDGPVGAHGPAPEERAIDAACARGGFHMRASSFSLATPDGRTFTAASERILRTVAEHASLTRWLGGAVTSARGAVVAETNPTIGMASCLPMADPATLPTRRRALRVADGAVIRAKSDWYWRSGASSRAAAMLGEDSVEAETHHERVAAIWCLAMAHALAGCARDGTHVVALGDGSGVYAIPAPFDPSWRRDLERVGSVSGVLDTRASVARALGAEALAVSDLAETIAESEEPLATEHEAAPPLVLTDNGGAHASANAWLRDCALPMRFRTMRSGTEFTILDRTGPSAPYRLEPTALDLARRTGFAGRHLSRANCHLIEVEYLAAEGR